MELLAEIGYNVTKLDEDEVQELHLDPPGDWYRFERRSPHQDLYEWICSRIVEVETKRISRRQRPARRFKMRSTRRRKVKVAHTQKTLPDY